MSLLPGAFDHEIITAKLISTTLINFFVLAISISVQYNYVLYECVKFGRVYKPIRYLGVRSKIMQQTFKHLVFHIIYFCIYIFVHNICLSFLLG